MELMVGLIISGIMIAATLPAFRTSFVGHRLRSSANQVQSQMRLARSRAIAEDIQYIIVLYPDYGKYYLVQDTNGDGSPDWGTEPKEGPTFLPDEIDLDNSLDQAFADDVIGFNQNGSAIASGVVAVENDRGEKLYIQILQSSGVTNILTQEEYDAL